jgi:hypothetical protein
MINWLLDKLFPIKDRFETRISATWFSNDYYNFEYRTGRVWKNIYVAKPPLFDIDISRDYNWTYEPLTIKYSNLSGYKDMFKSIEEINIFMENQYKNYEEGVKRHNEKLLDYYNNRKATINNFNKT